jgi:adenine/guanine phosphoribosyltransferase-like PRPP-binding protein
MDFGLGLRPPRNDGHDLGDEQKMQTYTVDIAGEPVTLPIVPINQKLAISLLMVIDMGVRFGERIGKALAARLGPLKPDIIVGAATLGIPVVIEVSRALGLDDYVIAQKSPKIHLADALVEELESVTSAGKQRLMLDRRAVPLLAGRRVAVVDDVVATGSSLAATLALARAAGGQIVGAGVILTEGHDWKQKLGADAGLVQGLGHIPQFTLNDGKATPMPETL